MSVPLRFQILLPRRRCICNSHLLPARLIFLISIFAYSLFTAAQFLRRWFSVLTQTVTQTRNSERKSPEDKFYRLPEQFRQAAQLFFALFFSKRYSLFTATHFLRHPFSHAVQIICYSQTQSIQTLSSTDDFVGQV